MESRFLKLNYSYIDDRRKKVINILLSLKFAIYAKHLEQADVQNDASLFTEEVSFRLQKH